MRSWHINNQASFSYVFEAIKRVQCCAYCHLQWKLYQVYRQDFCRQGICVLIYFALQLMKRNPWWEIKDQIQASIRLQN